MSRESKQVSLLHILSSQTTPKQSVPPNDPQSTDLTSSLQQHPYLNSLQNLLQQQISLQLPLISSSQPSILTSVLSSQLKQFTAQVKIQQMKMLRVHEEQVYGQVIENSVYKIVELNQKIAKVKEFYLYCRQLKNGVAELAQDFEKYSQYAKKQSTIVQQLQNYLNNPIISDIIFREYLKTYNVNIFTSDLITHYFQLNIKGLLKQIDKRQFQAERIPQLVTLQKENVVFKQLYDINFKYSELQEQLKHSYINNVISILFKYEENQQTCIDRQPQKTNKKHDTFLGYSNAINSKLQSLNYLIGKMTIMGNSPIQHIQNTQVPILVNEYQENFNHVIRCLGFSDHGTINKAQLHHEYKLFIASIFQSDSKLNQSETLASFFQKNLIFEQENYSLQMENECKQHKFEFLQDKIIKTETLIVMNKIFSTFNMFSYILQQINPGSCKEAEYSFSSLKTYVETEFRGQFIHQHSLSQQSQEPIEPESKKSLKAHHHSPSHKAHFNVFIETDEFGNWMLLSGNQKLIYPSAIGGLVEILHYMVEVATLLERKCLYSRELMLHILSLKAEQICKIGEVVYNIYNVIKSKQVSCYGMLNDYMKFTMKGFIESELKWLQNLDLTRQQQELFLNELYEIERNKLNTMKDGHQAEAEKHYLEQRKRIADEMMHTRMTKLLTHFAEKAKKADFLSQIIYQLDSNYEIHPVLEQLLVCERYHHTTFYFHDHPQFYETVLYEIIQMRNHIKLDHYYTLPRLHEAFGFFTAKALSFGDILNRLARHSTKEIKVEQLLTFFGAQLKLKRIIFRGELYWLSYRGDSGKCRTFKQFVEEHAKEILGLAEESLEYFLNNIKEFVKKVDTLDQDIQKFKHYQTITGKMNNSAIRVMNLDSHLTILSHSELSNLTTLLCWLNPIHSILQSQCREQKVFTQLNTSIQINNKIKLQDLGQHLFMLEEKQRLGDVLFTMKSFGFELTYGDCFSMFVDRDRKSYLMGDEGLKLVINREKAGIVKHYEEVLLEGKRNLQLAIAIYRTLMMVALLSMREESKDEQERANVEDLLRHVSLPLNIIEQKQRIRQIFTPSRQSDPSSHELNRLLRIKSSLLRLLTLTSSTHLFNSLSQIDYQSHCIQTICMVAKLSIYTQKRIVQKLQRLSFDIVERDTTDEKQTSRKLKCLTGKVIDYFLELMNNYQQDYLNSLRNTQAENQHNNQQIQPITFHTIQQALSQVQLQFLQKLLNLSPLTTPTFTQKQPLTLFSNQCGYKVHQDPERESSPNSFRAKQISRRNDRKMIKKALFSPVRSTHAVQSNIMQDIQKRMGIEMIKESIGLRKVISKLELEEKKMKDEIAWETSKLQHNVIKKIHAFITESNIDQEQSYINFKYTVNLETIKGMQNVIREQTQLAIKASEETMKIKFQNKADNTQRTQKSPTISLKKQPQEADFFLTNPSDKPKQTADKDEQSKLGYQNSRMLNTNIDSIFNHLRKIKVFAAWKKVNRNMDLTNEEWKNFNKNVANLLHNEENIRKIELINKKRSECFKENILCSLLKEENSILSEKIRTAKVESLSKIVQEYKKKLIGGDTG